MYIEDIIQDAAEHNQVSPNDRELFASFSQQIHDKQLALTDRQYHLACLKLDLYSALFEFRSAKEFPLKYPLRKIDRERSVKISDNDNLEIKYVFNKKLINFIESCKKWHRHDDKKQSLHYYEFTDQSCFHIVNILQHHQFQIDPNLLERFEQLRDMYNNSESVVPGIYNNKIKNIPAAAIEKMHTQFGEPCDDNMFIYMDRRYDLGLVHFDQDYIEHENEIVEAIVNRKLGNVTAVVNITAEEVSAEQLGEALNILKRDKVKVSTSGYFSSTEEIDVAIDFALELSKTFNGVVKSPTHADSMTSTVSSTIEVVERRREGKFNSDDTTPVISINPTTTSTFRKMPLLNLAICYNTKDKPFLYAGIN